jgi:PadR family transcriptional regulator, regulatory protein PadR
LSSKKASIVSDAGGHPVSIMGTEKGVEAKKKHKFRLNEFVSSVKRIRKDMNNDPRIFSRFSGNFSLTLLSAIRKLGDRATGTQLRQSLSESLGRDVAIGQLYLTLSKMEDQGLISYRVIESKPTRGGRAKKLYQLETLGAQVLNNAATKLRT